MNETIVDKVAQALVENFVKSGWKTAQYMAWDDLPENRKETARNQARAAIKAYETEKAK